MPSLDSWAAIECPGAAVTFASADPAALGSRSDAMISAFTAVLAGGSFDGDAAITVGTDVGMGYIGVVAPIIVLAVLILGCGVPLCIARCCAHKCCKPRLDPDSDVPTSLPSKRLQIGSVACLFILGLGERAHVAPEHNPHPKPRPSLRQTRIVCILCPRPSTLAATTPARSHPVAIATTSSSFITKKHPVPNAMNTG